MNWLAHSLLSDHTPEFRLGNLLPDFLTAGELARMDSIFDRGVACHRWIDAFTDRHAVVRRSVRRFGPQYRRVAPILVDVFYDHFLSLEWDQYSVQELGAFISDVYRSFDCHRGRLPASLWPVLQRMREEDWLGSYLELEGLQRTLQRMERRFRRPVDLVGGLTELERNYAGLHEDFREFFPELRAQVAAFNADSRASTPASP